MLASPFLQQGLRAIAVLQCDCREPCAIPLYACAIAAGFPSPADDHLDAQLDLNQLLIQHPSATFFLRVEGDSMVGAGIHSGDLLVVDRALEPADGRVVVAALDGELTVKRLRFLRGRPHLVPENPNYDPLPVGEDSDCHIWGVVTNVVHTL
ncbi:LexA family protein [Rubidibacter lacunae]|uniref:LexA family protein n=1 Tax=Rubidibacter lacunae TaxID=582514 RepID=UPI0003F665D2|nr:translesion error-prone DNA polymerase V autoproteolytic subunit [Rubidibacter lacunae]